jgi:cytochrome c oxidase subunit 2
MRSKSSLVAVAALAALAVVVPGSVRAEDNARGRSSPALCAVPRSRGRGNQLAPSPAIAGLAIGIGAQLQNFKSGARGMHPEDTAGLRMYPMSQTLKTDADIDAIAAYVAAMPPVRPAPVLTGGDPARGAQLYQVCLTCHGPDGVGNPAVQSPRIAGASDWYLLSSLQKFKAGIRGTYPTATIMRGMAATLPDEQAMKDVIAHIMTLSSQTAAIAK